MQFSIMQQNRAANLMDLNEINTVWIFIGKVGVFLGVIVAIVQAVKYLVSLMPTTKLDNRVKEIEGKQANDYEHLKEIDRRIEHLEQTVNATQTQIKEVNEGIQRIGKSQISLLRHMIDGNGIDKMKEESEELTEFFITR